MAEKQLHCAFCKAILFDDDDVVYCPECGAPHHRECYNSLGHCARIEYHGLKEQPKEQPEEEKQRGDRDREGRVCNNCGKISSSDTLFCPYCNARFIEPEQQSGPAVPPEQFDPYNSVSPDEEIGGVSATEVASYVRINTRRYLPRFKTLDKSGKKVSWNWCAFLFGPSWLFFRKCHLYGLGAMLFSAVAYLMMCPMYSDYNRALYGVFGNMTAEEIGKIADMTPYVERVMTDFFKMSDQWTALLFYLGILFMIGVHLVIGLFGDRIYLSHCVEKIRVIRENEEIDNKLQAMLVMGGVNPFAAALSFYGASLVFQLLLNLFVA